MTTTKQHHSHSVKMAKFTQQVYSNMHKELSNTQKEIQSIVDHLLDRQGKVLRPTLVYCTANLYGKPTSEVVKVATAAEIIHLASLVHDDIIDNSNYRRGQKSVNYKWGTKSAVLIGDYLFSRAFSLLTESSHNEMLKIYTEAISKMCQGELLQSSQKHNPLISEQKYFDIIDLKTASLLMACCKSGGLLANCNQKQLHSLTQFGLHLGRAYQIIDDLKDITSINLGDDKPGQKDIHQGIVTLPIIYLIQKQPKTAKQLKYLWSSNVLADTNFNLKEELIQSNTLKLSIDRAQSELYTAQEHLCKVLTSDPSDPDKILSQNYLNLLISKLEKTLNDFQSQISNNGNFTKQFT